MVTQAQNSEIDRLNAFRNISNDAMLDQRSRMTLGGDLLNNAATQRNNSANTLNDLLAEENRRYLGSITGLNNLVNTQGNLQNNIMDYRGAATAQNAALQTQYVNSIMAALGLTGAQVDRGMNILGGGNDILAGLATLSGNNIGSLQQARLGVNPGAATNPFAGMGQTAASIAQGLLTQFPNWGRGNGTYNPNDPYGDGTGLGGG